MNDFEGLLASDFGFKPSGKSAPMSASSTNSSKAPNFDLGSSGPSRSTRSTNSFSRSSTDDRNSIFGPSKAQEFGNSFSDFPSFFFLVHVLILSIILIISQYFDYLRLNFNENIGPDISVILSRMFLIN